MGCICAKSDNQRLFQLVSGRGVKRTTGAQFRARYGQLQSVIRCEQGGGEVAGYVSIAGGAFWGARELVTQTLYDKQSNPQIIDN